MPHMISAQKGRTNNQANNRVWPASDFATFRFRYLPTNSLPSNKSETEMGVDDATGNETNGGAAQPRVFARPEQTFPELTAPEIARMRRFGEIRKYSDGERLFETGKPGPGMFVVLSGHVAITQRDGLGHVTPVIDQGPGQFLAEIGQLSGRVALVDGHAEGDVETLLIPPDRLRALLVAEADLGERIMRALILRRVSLIQGGVGGPVLIGPSNSTGVVRLQGFLTRNGFPHHLLDPERDHDAADLITRYSPSPSDWPLVVSADGRLRRQRRGLCAQARRRRGVAGALGGGRERRALPAARNRKPRDVRRSRRLVLGLPNRGAALR